MSLPEASPAEKHPRLANIARRAGVVLHKINATPRWMLWLKAVTLVAALGAGVYYLMPGIRPLAISSELVIGTRDTPTSFMRETSLDADGKPVILETGFDHDLAETFARSINKKARFVIAADAFELQRMLARGDIHMAAAWLTPRFVNAPPGGGLIGADDELDPYKTVFRASRPYARDTLTVVQAADTLPLTSLQGLHQQELHALESNANRLWLNRLEKKGISPILESHSNWNELDLLKAVSEHRMTYAVMPQAAYRIGQNYVSNLDSTVNLGYEDDIVWVFHKRSGDALLLEANQFLNEAESDGTLRQLRDRYFGAVDRLQEADRSTFLARTKSRLPKYLTQFKRAQAASGYDWRLLAALAYQESQWEAGAVSKTGVRGLMMLTGDTADRLGVRNRLDPYESIMGGARYMDYLRDEIPASVPEPDRTWMAIASYNVGPGQISAARTLAKSMQLNPDSWADLKKALPRLGQTKSGVKIRGGEAVVTAENVRMYYAILSRLYPASTGFSLTTPTRTYGISTPR